MGIVKGKNLRIKINSESIFHATDGTFDSTMDFTEIESKDTDGKLQIPDGYSWSMTVGAFVAHKEGGATQNDYKDLIDAHLARQTVPVEFTTDQTGELLISGNVYIASFSITAGTTGQATFSANLTGDGDYTAELVPVP